MSSARAFLKAVVPAPHRDRVRRAWRSAKRQLVRASAPVLYRGTRVHCPCCERSFRKFLPTRSRANARCPVCGSLERHRLLYLYLRDVLALFSNEARVLHFAPERSLERRLRAAPALDYVSADLAAKGAMVKVDITDIPFADGSFDVIICSHVLEHVEDDRRAIRELYRVTAPGGRTVVLVPIAGERTHEDPTVVTPEERLRVFGQVDHVRRCGHDYHERLAEAGFDVQVEDYARRLTAGEREKYGIKSRLLYCCTKGDGVELAAASRQRDVMAAGDPA